jgi:hypothetical protein
MSASSVQAFVKLGLVESFMRLTTPSTGNQEPFNVTGTTSLTAGAPCFLLKPSLTLNASHYLSHFLSSEKILFGCLV